MNIQTLNQKAQGYAGIWYYNEPSDDEYRFKYSGGLGTYPANHQPFAVYRPEAGKTYFCYGGTTENGELLHMVSYYDHVLHVVPRPTIVLNKKTTDAHDNPVISIDEQGYIWLFSTSHGTARPSYIHRSSRPYDIDVFECVDAVTVDGGGVETPLTNFSYMQAWHVSDEGFVCFFTKYDDPARRTNCFMTSSDGRRWSERLRLSAMEEGHYQISALSGRKAATVFNYHPRIPGEKGLNHRTNLYYMETDDFGRNWYTADRRALTLPLSDPQHPALVYDYKSEGLNVYLMDMQFDHLGRPVILYIASPGYQSGPGNNPRTWTIAHWTGAAWEIKPAMTSDSNYDMGSLYVEGSTWRLIGPTAPGPQPYNPGGEIVMWLSDDMGESWREERQLTSGSAYNHTYVRRPLHAHPDFYALWADGDCRRPSPSRLYYCNREGEVAMLPVRMTQDFEAPVFCTMK